MSLSKKKIFNCSTPLEGNKRKFLYERNHDEENYTLNRFWNIDESKSETQESSLANVSEVHSCFSSIEYPRKRYVRRDEKFDSFLNVQNSYVTSKLSLNATSIIDGDDHLDLMISMEEKEVSNGNNNLTEDHIKLGYNFDNKGYVHNTHENIPMSQYAMPDVSQIIEKDDKDIYLRNVNTNIYSSNKDELIRKYRKRQQKIIIDDDEEAGMSLRRVYASNIDVMYDDSTRRERSLYRTMNTSRNERKKTLGKENEELSEFLENNSVNEQDFITIMKKLANNKREINQINLEEECKYEMREERVSLNESVFQRRTRELLKENNMLRRAVTINEITKELTAEDWMLLKDALENNDRELNDMMKIMEDLADKNVMLETETARMTKIVVNVADILADIYKRQRL